MKLAAKKTTPPYYFIHSRAAYVNIFATHIVAAAAKKNHAISACCAFALVINKLSYITSRYARKAYCTARSLICERARTVQNE